MLKSKIIKKLMLIINFLVSRTGLISSFKYLTITVNNNNPIGHALNLSGIKIVALFR